MKREDIAVKFHKYEWLALLLIFLFVGLLFFILMNVKKPDIADFGISEILFSIAFAVFMTGFLLWAKAVSLSNPYLGFVIGLVGTGVLAYAFSLKYRGFYSTIFIIVTGLIVLVYLGINFFKYRKDERYIEGEFDDR